MSKNRLADRHVANRHMAYEHVTYRPVAYRLVANRHIAVRHMANRHLTNRHMSKWHVTNRHVINRHVTNRHVTYIHVTNRHVTHRHMAKWHAANGHLEDMVFAWLSFDQCLARDRLLTPVVNKYIIQAKLTAKRTSPMANVTKLFCPWLTDFGTMCLLVRLDWKNFPVTNTLAYYENL